VLRAGSYLIPTILAVALHAVVIALLAQSWFEHDDPVRKVPRHVQAQVVDMKSAKAQKKAEAEAKARKKADQQRRADAEKKRKADEKRKQDLAKKKAAEKKRQQEIAKKKAAEEKKKAADKKRQQEIAKKKAEQARIKKAEAEKKRKAEAAKKAAEAKKKQEAARKAAAEKAAREEAARQAQNEALQQALEEEEAAIRAEEERASAMSYEAYIVDQITRNWRRSPSARNGMVVEVTVHLLPSGRVNDRYVTKSSGDSRFDNDALRAIDRVQVFEKLQEMDPVVFDRYFRKRIFRFRPEDLRN
jgi:colicin import membrane protein